MKEKTLVIVKPDAVGRNLVGNVIAKFEEAGLKVIASRVLSLRREEAETFYAVHKERPFFGSLCDFMCSGPCMPLVLEGDDAIKTARKVMGATDPDEADEGTIRKEFAESKERNSVHGSDAPEAAAAEISFFFPTTAFLTTSR